MVFIHDKLPVFIKRKEALMIAAMGDYTGHSLSYNGSYEIVQCCGCMAINMGRMYASSKL
jgi:hypothetical protein